MIPKLLHQIWIGPRAAPVGWTRTWREMNPDFEYRLWGDRDIEDLGLRNLDVYRRFRLADRYDGAADVARAEILLRFGGLYADADSVALRPLAGASFLEAGFFATIEPSESHGPLVSNAFMGATPGHPVLERYIEVLSSVRSLRPFRESGPLALTRLLEDRTDGDVQLLPSWTFMESSLAGERQVGGDPYARHFWSTTAERWGRPAATPYPER
jgi:mannosyltransferase OCH1-like enzyme